MQVLVGVFWVVRFLTIEPRTVTIFYSIRNVFIPAFFEHTSRMLISIGNPAAEMRMVRNEGRKKADRTDRFRDEDAMVSPIQQ